MIGADTFGIDEVHAVHLVHVVGHLAAVHGVDRRERVQAVLHAGHHVEQVGESPRHRNLLDDGGIVTVLATVVLRTSTSGASPVTVSVSWTWRRQGLVDGQRAVGGHDQAGPLDALEARELEGHRVGAGRQQRETETAVRSP